MNGDVQERREDVWLVAGRENRLECMDGRFICQLVRCACLFLFVEAVSDGKAEAESEGKAESGGRSW